MSTGPRKGIYAAAITAIGADREPDTHATVENGRWLLANGCDGLAILGTTGEANSLSVEQRERIIESVCHDLPRERLMLGTGCCALADSVRLTRHALAAGCPHVLMLPTFYYKNQSDDAVYASFAEVFERVGDSRLRVYLYHFPQLSATPIPLAVVDRLIADYPETVIGLKDSSGDFENYSSVLLKNHPGFAVFPGSERFLLDALKLGGPGSISATSNVICHLAGQVLRHWEQGSIELAEQAQANLSRLRAVLQDFPMLVAAKQLTLQRSGNPVWGNVLPPMLALSDEARGRLNSALEQAGFFADHPEFAPAAVQAAQ